MNIGSRFTAFIEQHRLFSKQDRLLLAVSGGLDSAVLTHLCFEAGYDFSIAHCNFQLRGEESLRDEQFVSALANRYKKRLWTKTFDTAAYASDKKISIQAAARELRYSWFYELLDEEPRSVCIVTAHHQDDSIETMLMNFFRGTGISGLHGILPKKEKIVRPLLFARKQELEMYARDNMLTWVEDSSNQSDKYARNYFRRQLIPFVIRIYPEAEENLAANLERFRDAELLYNQAVARNKKKLLSVKGSETHMPVLKLLGMEARNTILYEIIKDFGFTAKQTGDAAALLHSETGRYVQSATHRIIRNRNWLIISPLATLAAQHILIDEPGITDTADFQLEISYVDSREKLQPVPTTRGIACLDAKSVTFPLLLRKWKAGDYFYPLGMPKKKKLARFFIDQKLSATDKEKVWVLESNKKIIWVVGHRIDDRCKLTEQSKKVLRCNLKILNV